VAQREASLAAREAEAAERHLRELQASERRFHSAFTHASIGMALLAFDGRILLANPALSTVLGEPAEALAQRMASDRASTFVVHRDLGQE
jgi:PAS domain-containing protein